MAQGRVITEPAGLCLLLPRRTLLWPAAAPPGLPPPPLRRGWGLVSSWWNGTATWVVWRRATWCSIWTACSTRPGSAGSAALCSSQPTVCRRLAGWLVTAPPPSTSTRSSSRLSPSACALEAGVVLRLHSWVVNAIVEDGRVAGVIVKSKSGRQAILARLCVDATGDGDIAAAAGCDYASHTMAIGLPFKAGGVAWRRSRPSPPAIRTRSATSLPRCARRGGFQAASQPDAVQRPGRVLGQHPGPDKARSPR